MMAVIGAARPAAPAAIPSATSRTAAMPASLWAKSTMTRREPSRNRFSRPGERSVDGAEVEQAVADLLERRAEAARPTGRRQGVGDVVPGQPADRDRDAADLDDAVATVALDLGQPARRARGRPDRRRRGGGGRRPAAPPSAAEREERDPGADPPGDRGHERVVAVEHDPAVRLGDAADGRLDLGQLGQRVDALQVEMVGRDVGQDATRRSTRSPCRAGRSRRARSRGRRHRCRSGARICWAPPGPVQSPGLDHPLVDEHPVGGRRADMPARPAAGCG